MSCSQSGHKCTATSTFYDGLLHTHVCKRLVDVGLRVAHLRLQVLTKADSRTTCRSILPLLSQSNSSKRFAIVPFIEPPSDDFPAREPSRRTEVTSLCIPHHLLQKAGVNCTSHINLLLMYGFNKQQHDKVHAHNRHCACLRCHD